MNVKGKNTKKQVNVSDFETNVIERHQLIERAEQIRKDLKASTWRELETQSKFSKNEKLSFISDDMLILGCDIGSETHYIRGIDSKGRELSKKAFGFANDEQGFTDALDWSLNLAAKYDKKQIVLGLEPTGHYWFCLATWMISKGISVVQVNPYAVKQTKEIEDNSQLKDDRKDPKVIANLVKNGNYGMPYLPEGIYADMRRLTMFRDQLMEDRIRCINRLHREMKICFPEYMDAFGKLDGTFALTLIKEAPFPKDILKLGNDGIRDIWHQEKLRGRGYSRADEILRYAEMSVGIKEGTSASKDAVKWFAAQAVELENKLNDIEDQLCQKFREIPNAENVLDIKGIGDNTLAGILAEMGDIERFDDVKEIQKLSGLNLVACSSGKHKGETKISHRGRKRLRYWLFQAAKSAVVHADEFAELHLYYTTRQENPLKKMQSLIVIACKILRVIYTLLKTGQKYDPEKLLKDIKRPVSVVAAA